MTVNFYNKVSEAYQGKKKDQVILVLKPFRVVAIGKSLSDESWSWTDAGFNRITVWKPFVNDLKEAFWDDSHRGWTRELWSGRTLSDGSVYYTRLVRQ